MRESHSKLTLKTQSMRTWTIFNSLIAVYVQLRSRVCSKGLLAFIKCGAFLYELNHYQNIKTDSYPYSKS
jgi:hypothetical protein